MIAEYGNVKKDFPEFTSWVQQLKARLIAKASADWSPMTYGNFNPKGALNQFGDTTILPALFQGVLGTQLPTWNQVFTTTGSQIILAGVNSGLIPRDFMVGIIGFMFADKAIRLSEVKFQVGDEKFIRLNVEEARVYEKPTFIIEEGGWILPEKQGFDMMAYVLTRGQQRIVPLGLQLNKIPNKLQVTNCGAAVTD